MAKPYNATEISIQLEKELFEDAGETAFAMLRNFIFRSPVGNPDNWQEPDSAPPGYVGGHFRRNWQVTIGGFNSIEIPGSGEPAAATMARGKTVINVWAKTKTAFLVLQNNVPYANRLAQGHSLQAEAGWIDQEIALALQHPRGRRDLR